MEKQTVKWTYRKANTERYKKTDRHIGPVIKTKFSSCLNKLSS